MLTLEDLRDRCSYMRQEIWCLQIILNGTRKDTDMIQGTSLDAEECEEKVKDSK